MTTSTLFHKFTFMTNRHISVRANVAELEDITTALSMRTDLIAAWWFPFFSVLQFTGYEVTSEWGILKSSREMKRKHSDDTTLKIQAYTYLPVYSQPLSSSENLRAGLYAWGRWVCTHWRTFSKPFARHSRLAISVNLPYCRGLDSWQEESWHHLGTNA